ncbi:MAG: hopanoid-associated sugar epimerase [Dehalococcoidia bacterium]
MDALVTGGTGFIGGRLVRRLVERGASVRVLARASSRRDLLADLAVEYVEGDLRDPVSLQAAVRGCRRVFHVAADYRLWSRHPEDLYATNVQGTRHLIEAAVVAGVERIVYTSSVGALGLPADGRPGDENTPATLGDMVGHYKRSKFQAEQEVLRLAGTGAPVVLVPPSTPVGPGDAKPTPTGQMIVDFLSGRMPAFVDTGLNLVHVDDVAEGHLLAAERGQVGGRYILGHRNMTLREIFDLLGVLTGLPSPRREVPLALALAAGHASQWWSDHVSHRPPRVPLEGVRMARKRMFFDGTKAVRELGMPQTAIDRALIEAVEWFRSHGMPECRNT